MKGILFCIALFFCLSAFAQTAQEANRLFNNRQFAEAGRMYEVLLRQNPNSALFNYRFARCMYEQGNLELARIHFYRSGTRYALTNFYLGQIYFALGQYSEAIAAYERFLPTITSTHWRFPHVQARLAQARRMVEAKSNEQNIAELVASAQIMELTEQLFNNRQFAELVAMYEALLKVNPHNELLNYRFARTLFELEDRERALVHFLRSGTGFPRKNFYLGEIYFFNYEFGNAAAAYRQYLSTLRAGDRNIPNIERRIRQSEQAAQMLLRVEDIAIIDSIVVDKNDFLRFYRLAQGIGTLTQRTISINEGRTETGITYITPSGDMKFMSDFLNGQMTILTSHWLLSDWSALRPLEANVGAGVNMNYPFVKLDGVTMFFASDGEDSIGGYDIFITRYFPAANTFLPPKNIGMPFNSPFNDFMLVIDEINNVGWFASDRFQPPGKVIIYSFVPNQTRVFLDSNNIAEVRSRAKLRTFRQAEQFTSELDFFQAQRAAQTAAQRVERIAGNAPQPAVTESAANFLNRRELRRYVEETERMRTRANNLRQEYVLTQSVETRAAIVREIRELERNIQENERLIRFNTSN